MLSIRMVRGGKRHAPAFRIIVQEKSRAPRSKYIEKLGHYIPHQKPKVVEINAERVLHWISQGAQPTDSVHNLLVSQGIIKNDKRGVTSITKKRADKLDDKKKASKEKAEAKKAAEAEAKASDEEEKKEDAPVEIPTEEEKVVEAEDQVEEVAPAEDAMVEEKKEDVVEDPAVEEKKEDVSAEKEEKTK